MTGCKLLAFYQPTCRIMMHFLLEFNFWWTLTGDKNKPLRYLMLDWLRPQCLALGLMCCYVWPLLQWLVHLWTVASPALLPVLGQQSGSSACFVWEHYAGHASLEVRFAFAMSACRIWTHYCSECQQWTYSTTGLMNCAQELVGLYS
jgi:hypothetical protein